MSKAFVKEGDEPEDEGAEPEPKPSGSPVITAEGKKRLEAELEQLWKVERPRIANEVMWAAAQGDRSENAEYIYGKRRLREIDRRVRWLSKRLDEVVVVTEAPGDGGRVFFGAWVTLEDEEGDEAEYRIVGADESDVGKGWISIDSPVAKAILGKREGDEVTVVRPKGEATYVVVGIRYRAEAE